MHPHTIFSLLCPLFGGPFANVARICAIRQLRAVIAADNFALASLCSVIFIAALCSFIAFSGKKQLTSATADCFFKGFSGLATNLSDKSVETHTVFPFYIVW